MGFQISPGINISEIDLTTIVPAVGTTIGAIAGPFRWGPANKPMLIDSELTLVSTFGKPDNATANTWFTAANFLAYANALQTVRVVSEAASGGHKNATADGSGVLIANEDVYLNNYANGQGNVGMFAAKYPGDLGNSLAVSIADADSFNSWPYKTSFTSAPGTSTLVANGGGSNDEMHIAVIDTLGWWTGTAGTVLETFPFVSKCAAAKYEDGSTIYYPEVINRTSKYVWWMDHPSEADLGINTTPNWGSSDFTLDYDTTSEKVTVTSITGGTGSFTVGEVVGDAAGAVVSTGSGAVLGTVEVGNGGITNIAVTAPGSGYSSITPPVVLISGVGVGAVATAVVSGGGTVTGIVINNTGSGYDNTTTASITAGSGASATAVLAATGGVKSVTVSGSGTGYTNTDPVIFTGNGTSAAGHLNVDGGGNVTSVTITNPGSGYSGVVTAAATNPGSGNTFAVVLGYAVDHLTSLVGGSNYVAAPTVVFTGTTYSDPLAGTIATATAVLTSGVVTSVTGLPSGSLYTAAPTVSFTPLGSGATTGAITLNTGKVLAIPVLNGGSGYVVAPTVHFSSGSAAATAVLGTGGNSQKVDHIVVGTPGSGYDPLNPPTATIVPVGSGATAVVTVNSTGRVTALTPTAVGSGYTVAPTVQILGPGIGAQVTAVLGSGPTAGQVVSYTVNSGGSGYQTISATVLDYGASVITVAPISGAFTVGMVIQGLTSQTSATVTTLAGGEIDKTLSGGVDGNTVITDGNYQVTETGAPAGFALFQSGEDIDVSLVLGAAADQETALYLINDIAEYRKDCVAFLSPPLNTVLNNSGNEAVDIVAFRNLLPSSSYCVMDSGWKYQYDKYNDVYRWVPLNGDVAGLCVRTDTVRDPWWSPAGYNRGLIQNVVRLAWNPRKAYRDLLYQNGVNAVISQAGQGTLLYGDKTLLSKPSAFDRINVRRLFIVLEKAISTAAKYTLFEFNDQFTQAQFVNMVVPYLNDVMGRRGIYDFRVVCDSTNNTPEVVDANQFIGDIYIKPARSINFIQLNFIAVRTGVDFSEIVGKF